MFAQRAQSHDNATRVAAAMVTAALTLVGCNSDGTQPTDAMSPEIAEGQRIFRFDTFGDEQFWTDTLRMHEVVEKSVDPTTALAVGPQGRCGRAAARACSRRSI